MDKPFTLARESFSDRTVCCAAGKTGLAWNGKPSSRTTETFTASCFSAESLRFCRESFNTESVCAIVSYSELKETFSPLKQCGDPL